MKKSQLIRVLCAHILVIAGSAHAAWIEVDSTYRDEVTYVDSSRARREGGRVFSWSMSTYKKARELNGKTAMSDVKQSVIDCERQLSAFAFFAWYEGPNATGQNINTMTVAEGQLEFHPIVPNSIGDKEAKVACSVLHKQQ